jgi:hypothetical protein
MYRSREMRCSPLRDWRRSRSSAESRSRVREGKVVKRGFSSERAQSWVVDYSAARARAIEWLGDRYLLAKPVNATESGWRTPPRRLLNASPVAARSAEQSS